jgi:myotubularin-related protein 1/2
MTSWERDDAALFLDRDESGGGGESMASAVGSFVVERGSLAAAAVPTGASVAARRRGGGSTPKEVVASGFEEIVSPTSSSSSNGSHGGMYGLLEQRIHVHRLGELSPTHQGTDTDENTASDDVEEEEEVRGARDENELQFGDMDDDDRDDAEDVALRNGRLALALDLDASTAQSLLGSSLVGAHRPSSMTRKTSSSFSDLGDYDDFSFADTTPTGTPTTPNTPTFRLLYDGNGSQGRSIYSGMSNAHHVSPATRGSIVRSGRSTGRTTPTPRCGMPADEHQPLAGTIYPVAGEIVRMEVENAAYIIFYKIDEAEKDGPLDENDRSEDAVASEIFTPTSVSVDSDPGEITAAFCRPPRSLISLGAAGHKVRTTNCFTRDYAHPTRSLGRGLFRASTSVGSAFLKGAAGLVNQTYQGGANGGVFGFAKGLGMGMLGLGTHTVKGAFRGVGQVTNVVGEMVMGSAPHYSIDGMLILTNYRLIWVSQSTQDTLEVPLSSILAIDSSATAPHVINIECKTLLRMSIAFRDESTSYDVLSSVWDLYSDSTFVFAHIHYQALLERGDKSEDALRTPLYEFYNAEDDYRRLKLLDETSWMQLLDNADYALFPSYPSTFVVPAELDEEDLRELSVYRSASRVPAVVWRHPHSGAMMCRCAQPCAGLSGYVADADKKFVAAMQRATGGGDESRFHFYDARSQMAATANSAQGKGTEDPRNYPNTELHFCDIANIHAVRSSFASLSAVCQPGEDRYGSDWPYQLRNTFWFMHISSILASAQAICQTLCQGESTMVHCSDGWDRTPQLTGLIQLLLDPYYRTLHGFLCLIEKEWCCFGHMFRSRYSQGEGPGHQEVEEQSPVFVQWIDSLWQIWRQQSWAFEFNEALLALLYDSVYSGLYGNFLYNNERERRDRELDTSTRSLWSLVMEKRDQYINLEYDCAKNFNSVGIILPFSSEEDELALWESHLAYADPVTRKYS